MDNVVPFVKKPIISEIHMQIEHITLDDGSFWYRMYNPIGKWWTEWIRSEQ